MLPGNTTDLGAWLALSGAGGGAAAEGDPYWSKVSFLTHANGTNGSKNITFVDYSANNVTVSGTGTPNQGTFGPVGSSSTVFTTSTHASSIYFNGSGDSLSISNNAALALGSGDFTLECWVWLNITSLPGNAGVYDQRNGTNGGSVIQPILELGTTPNGYGWYVAANYMISSGTAAVKFKQWQHIAVSRVTGSTRMYIDGQQVGSTYSDSNNYPAGSITIGRENDGVNTRYLTGYISNLRTIVGTGLYSGSSITVPTSPLTRVAGTALLLPFSNAGLIDHARKSNVLMFNSPQISNSVTKFGSGSIYFPGSSGDNVRVPNHTGTDFTFANDSFTIEMWIYPTAQPSGSYAYLYSQRNGDSDITPFSIALYKNINLYLTVQGSTNGASQDINNGFATYGNTAPLALNNWHHIAVVRNTATSTISAFVNGISVFDLTSITGTLFSTTNPINFGSQSTVGTASSNFTGYIDEIRVTKGLARYTSNFTSATSEFYDSASVFAVSKSVGSVDEGSSITFTLTSSGIPNGTQVPYTLSGTGITASRFTSNSLTGVFTITSNSATLNLGIANNYVTDGSTTAIITIVNTSTSFVINDTSLSPTYTLSAPASINEGSSGTITLTASGNIPPAGTVIPFSIYGTGISASRFISPVTTSSAFIMGGAGTATTNTWISANLTTDGVTVMTIRLTGSPSVTTSTTINDTSTTPVGGSGSAIYITPGTYTWTCPAGVTSVSVLAIGGGEGGTSHNTTSACGSGGASYFFTSATVQGGGGASSGGTVTTESTYSSSRGGGAGGIANSCGAAGGAGGYSGAGGNGGGGGSYAGVAGSGGGGGSGAVMNSGSSGGGGGVGIFGAGANGAAPSGSQGGGGGGSGGGNGGTGGGPSSVGHGQAYGKGGGVGAATSTATAGADGNTASMNGGAVTTNGGGAGGSSTSNSNSSAAGGGGGAFGGGGGTSGCWYRSGAGGGLAYINNYPVTGGQGYTVVVGRGGAGGSGSGGGGAGGSGAVRIVWPGTTRQFPSTCVST